MANMNQQQIKMIQGIFNEGTSQSDIQLVRHQYVKEKSSNQLSLNLTVTSRQQQNRFLNKKNQLIYRNQFSEKFSNKSNSNVNKSIFNLNTSMQIAQIAQNQLKKFNQGVSNNFNKNSQLLSVLEKCEEYCLDAQDSINVKYQALSDMKIIRNQVKKYHYEGSMTSNIDIKKDPQSRYSKLQIKQLKQKLLNAQAQIIKLNERLNMLQQQKTTLLQNISVKQKDHANSVETLKETIYRLQSEIVMQKTVNTIQKNHHIQLLQIENQNLNEKINNLIIEIQKQKLERTNYINKSKYLQEKLRIFETSGNLKLNSGPKLFAENTINVDSCLTDVDLQDFLKIFNQYYKIYKKKWDNWLAQFLQKNSRQPTNKQIQQSQKFDIWIHVKNFRKILIELKALNQVRAKYIKNYESPNLIHNTEKSKSPLKDHTNSFRSNQNLFSQNSNLEVKIKECQMQELEMSKKQIKKLRIQINRLQNENKNLLQNAKQLKQRLMNIEPQGQAKNQQLQYETQRLEKKCIQAQNQKKILDQKFQELSKKYSIIENEKKLLQQKLSELQKKNLSFKRKCHIEMQKNKKLENQNTEIKNNLQISIKDLQYHLNRERKQRIKLHNELEDLKGNIRVYCRVRPLLKYEIDKKSKNILDLQSDNVIIPDKNKKFKCDLVFNPQSTQQQVFQDTKKLIQSSIDGYNVCIFAYGQTGSGKTYTLHGTKQQPGIAPRSINQLFRLINQLKNHYSIIVQTHMIQIYLDNLIDLYDTGSKNKKNLQIKQDSRGGVYVQGCQKLKVTSAQMMENLYRTALNNRKLSSTEMNSQSSRSHLILMVFLDIQNNKTHEKRYGKFSLVDLAGSERSSKSQLKQNQIKQSKSINKSLSALNDVITSLYNKNDHTPYRHHKLTFLLRDSIGGNSKTLMFVNISPSQYNIQQTCISLQFASRIKNVQRKAASINKQKNFDEYDKQRKSLSRNQ